MLQHVNNAAADEPRAAYWLKRYLNPDWSNGIHVGRFSGLEDQVSLEAASKAADAALVQEIFERCSVFRLMTEFRVLEIGCGSGGLARRLYDALPKMIYHGYDISPSAIDAARQKFSCIRNSSTSYGADSDIEFKVGSIKELIFESTSNPKSHLSQGYDLIVIREVFYLLSELERNELISIAKKILRPGGVFYFADIFLTAESYKNDLCAYLYNRHFAAGPALTLSTPDTEGAKKWLDENFGQDFIIVDCELDKENIAKTYKSALEVKITNKDNELAYRKLFEIASSPNNGMPGIVYIKAFLFKKDSCLSSILGESDYRFECESSFCDVLNKGNLYGVQKGKWNLVIGRSGSGKTSLLRALERELPKVTGADARLINETRYFFLSQQIEVFENLSPIENINAFGSTCSKSRALLQQLGIPDRVINESKSAGLSGGEKQRLAIAQCIAADPDTIILDEPLKGLDKARRAVLFELLDGFLRTIDGDDGRTLICVDHDFESIYKRFDVVFEMMHGFQVMVWKRN